MSARQLAKRLAFGVAWTAAIPLSAMVWFERRFLAGEQAFAFGAQLLALAPGLAGSYLRAAYYFSTLDRCAWDTHVGFGSVFVRRAASIGRHTSTGCYCVFGNTDIGDGVMIGSRVSVPSGKRQHFDDEGRLSSGAGRFDRVRIGARCWIGDGAIVMADVGEASVVAAGSVVSSAMPSGSLVAGNPARVVRAVESTADVAVEA